MTIELNGITTNPTASTVLDYTINTNPNPLQISSAGSLIITVSKATPPAVQCTSLVFKVSVGSAGADLTTDPSSIGTQCLPEWSATPDGTGTFTFTYQGSDEIGQAGLLFVLDNIAVNSQVGTSYLSITENLQSGTSNGSLPLAKFPADFTVSDLTADSYSISPGGTVNLSWNGSPGGNYSLSYDGNTVSDLPNVDNYPVKNLQETTTFTLTVTAEGGTIQLVRQCTVTVAQPVIEEFGVVGNPGGAGVNSSFQLYWQCQNVDQCTLSLDGIPFAYSLPANMSKTQGYAVTAPDKPGTYLYTLSAVSRQGRAALDSSLTMFVEPLWLVTSIEIGPGLITGLLVSADGSRLYVSGAQLTVIDTATRRVIQSIDLSILSANTMALSPDGSQLYVASIFESGVLKINTSTWQVQTISVPGIGAGSKIDGVLMGAASGSNLVVYVTSNSLGTFYVLDPSNNFNLVEKLDLGVMTNTFAINPQGNQVCYIDYDALTNIASFYLYDVKANTKSSLKTIPTDLILYLSSNSDGSEYYATTISSFIAINPATGAISCSPDTKMSLRGFACSPDKTRLYTIAGIINEPNSSIWEVDASTLQQTAVLYTGSNLEGMTISPDGKQVYVVCLAEDASENSQLLIFGIG